jgi:hypothetical protein
MRWKKDASLPFRGTSSAMQILMEEKKIDSAPSHETCILWDLKIGLYKLNRRKIESTEWTWIVDHVIGQGSIKCLAVVGVPLEVLKKRENWSLSLKDLEPFGLVPMTHTRGEDVKKALIEITHSTGITPRTILSDHGSDLWFGVKEFCKNNGGRTIEQYDVCHKTAVELRKLFEKDEDWEIFTKKAAHAKRELHNTDGVIYAPPNQRRKARYQNVDILIGWADSVVNSKEQLSLAVQEKLKWIYEYKEKIAIWSQWVLIGEITRDEVRTRGFGNNIENRLSERLISIPMVDTAQQLACNLIDYVSFESEKLFLGERSLGSSESIESLFGYFKHIKNGLWDRQGGIGRLILSMASRVGEMTVEVVQEALELTRKIDVTNWISKSFRFKTA